MFRAIIAVAILADQGGNKKEIHALIKKLPGMRKGQLNGDTGFIGGTDRQLLQGLGGGRAGEQNCTTQVL